MDTRRLPLLDLLRVCALRIALWPFAFTWFRRTHRLLYKFLRPRNDTIVYCSGNLFKVNPFDMSSGYPLLTRGNFADDVIGVKVARALASVADLSIDVGANVGFFTVNMAMAGSNNMNVIAIEPDPQNLSYLRENIRINSVERVRVVAACAAESCGEVNLYVSRTRPGRNSLMLANVPNPTGSVRCKAIALDCLVPELEPGCTVFIKIDVEGVEDLVLAGARRLLCGDCALLLEFWKEGLARGGKTSSALLDQLERAGFSIKRLDDYLRRLTPISYESLRQVPCDEILNLLFYRPESRFNSATALI